MGKINKCKYTCTTTTTNAPLTNPAAMTTSIHTWLESTFPTPPPEEHSPPSPSLKRKRAMSLSSIPPVPASDGSSTSPKRQRVDDDVVQPYQSASQLGANPLALTERSVFSPPSRTSSARRSASPTRETPIILRSAYPPVLTESLNGLKDPPPAFVEQLGDRLVKGVDGGFIPQGLRDTIRNDPDVGYQITKTVDFDQDDSRSSEQLSNMWQEVKTIFLNARDCKDGSRDENAWCDDVVRPLVHLAIKIHGNGKWWFQNVQSQSINPAYLSTIPTSSPDPSRRKTIDRKTDFALSYSHRDPEISALYKQLDDANNPNISHTLDTFTKRTALFSGFEVKPASGDHTEAELQMSIWIAASLRKKRELACMAHPSEPVILAEPALTIVGHEHSIYYAYPRREAGRNGIHVLGPDVDRFERLSTDSIRGIFRLVRMYGNLLEYGMDKSKDGYWGGFLKPILDSLANVT